MSGKRNKRLRRDQAQMQPQRPRLVNNRADAAYPGHTAMMGMGALQKYRQESQRQQRDAQQYAKELPTRENLQASPPSLGDMTVYTPSERKLSSFVDRRGGVLWAMLPFPVQLTVQLIHWDGDRTAKKAVDGKRSERPFVNLSELPRDEANAILNTIKAIKPNAQSATRQSTYMDRRHEIVEMLRTVFMKKGGIIRRSVPHYMVVDKYGLPQHWNDDGAYGPSRYIEAHVWCDNPIDRYRTSRKGRTDG